MFIIVAGAGKIGFSICQMLSSEGHDVLLIDRNQKHLEEVVDKIDIMSLPGNASDFDLLQEAGITKADAFVSVTPDDEVNLLACMFANSLGVKLTVARVQSPNITDIRILSKAARHFTHNQSQYVAEEMPHASVPARHPY